MEQYHFKEKRFSLVDIELGIEYKEEIVDDIRELKYPNGSLKLSSYYLGGKLHGPSIFYASNGQALAKSWYIHGKQEGKSWLYYPDGALYSIQCYRHGVWEGEQQFFYPNGIKKSLMHYSKGQLNALTVLFEEDGSIKREILFQHGARKPWA